MVGLIVKLDDIGLWLMQKKSGLSQSIGKALLVIMPWFMKSLSVIGTIAMFLVGGGISRIILPKFITSSNI
ncbi:inner membrane protein [Actinobacillus equuli]|nr:inner membrane protein [Actinobacillus equuli]